MKKSVKRSLAIGAGVLVVVGGAWGYTTLKGATPDIDPSKLATVERGHDGPVGRRHRQDRADHQGRDQVEGQRHHRARCTSTSTSVVSAGRRAGRARQGEPARAACARRDANLQAARGRARRRRRRSSRRTQSRPRRPTSSSRSRNYDRAQQLFDAEAGRRSRRSTMRKSALEHGARTGSARAQAQLVDQPGASVAEAARQRGAGAGGRRARRGRARQRHHPRADPRARC